MPLTVKRAALLRQRATNAKGFFKAILFIVLLSALLASKADASTYFDFRASTGTAISNQADGTLCSTGEIVCKYIVINLGRPAADVSGIKYYQLNMAGFDIMSSGCGSGALDIAVYNDAAYTSLDHAFALDGSGASPSFFSASVNFSIPADKFAQLIVGCNDGAGTAVTLIDGGPGTYKARDINSIQYTGLPNLCVGDTPADCDAVINTTEKIFDFENQSGDIGTGNGLFELSIRLGQPQIGVGPGILQVQFFLNGTSGCPDPGYFFQTFADSAYTIPVGTAFKLLTTLDAEGNPITLQDYNGIVIATFLGAFDKTKYYTFGFESCDASRSISIEGDGAGNYVCTQMGSLLGLPCVTAYYENAFPYLIVSRIAPQTGTIIVATNNIAAVFVISDENGNTFQGNGLLFNQIVPPGAYTIHYGDVPGFITPSSAKASLDFGTTINFNGTYIAVPQPLGAPGTTNQQQFVAEPVSSGTGNYYYQHTDFSIPGRGKSLVFQRTYNTLDNYSGPLGSNWTHTYNVALTQTQGVVTIKWDDSHSEIFVPNGAAYVPQPGVFSMLTKNEDGSFTLTKKDQTCYEFAAAGKLLRIIDRIGNTTNLTYDILGNLIQVTDAGGRSLNFLYDLNDRIIQIVDPAGRTESFQYDLDNNLATVTDPAGGNTTWTYDANHRVLSITLPNEQTLLQNTYDGVGRVASQTNGLGRTWSFAYNTPNPGDTTVTDARGKKSIHTYDSLIRIVQMRDALGGIISYTYDGNNNRTSITNQSGKATTSSYDGQGNITAIADPAGNKSLFGYDAKNNLLGTTDARGNVTAFGYDGNCNLISIVDALGNTTKFVYDSLGQLTTKIDARGNGTAYLYDPFGNLIKITDALGQSTGLAYDSISRLTAVTDANNHTASSTYDALSRLVNIADPLGHQTQFAYDAVGNLLAITDANGNATHYEYDSVNDLTAVTDALGHVTRYTYDENNNRSAFINAKGNTTLYTFDSLNRLSIVADPLSFVTAYTYDAIGNVIAIKDANGNTNRFAYDALNRVVNISYGDGQIVTYSYDANGNRTAMTDTHGTTGYAYDALNRVLSVANPGGKTVQYQYNAIGHRQSITYPDGKVVAYAYDPVNRLSNVQDWLGRTTNYQYDPAGNLLSLAYPNHAGISFAYDNANRLTIVANSFMKSSGKGNGGSHHFGIFEYLLDAVGNRLQVSNGYGKAIHYSYDKLYELTGVTPERSGDHDDDQDDDEITASYEYDAAGNRIKQSSGHGIINYSYDAADRLLQAGDARYSFDANGNQISVTKTATSSPIVYRYDAANRLIAVVGGSVNSSFSYDGDGNRISQSAGLASFSYVNDIAAALPVVLQESGPDGDISYAYGLKLISESDSGFDTFYQYDGLGSVAGLTNLQGGLIQRYVYDAWGQTLRNSGPGDFNAQNKFQFTGEALDPGTGLYYLRARYYDPSVGRFTKKDPLPESPWLPVALQPYSYALNNPLLMTDSSGLSPSLTFENFSLIQQPMALFANSTVPFAPTPPAPPAPPTSAQQQQIQSEFQQLVKNDPLLRDCGGSPYCTTFRREELLKQAELNILGQNAPRPSTGEIFAEFVLALSYLLNGFSGAAGGPGGQFGPTQ